LPAKIDYVVLAAARVGGIHANNTYPAEFIYLNLMIEANVIHEAYRAGVKRLLFLGSSCIYPKFAPQPMKEEYLLTGTLEPTNEPYAVAKIAGIKMCNAYNRQYGTDYRSVMPTNLYGPEDNFHLQNSHVLPALIRKFHLARLALNDDLEGLRRDEQVFGAIPADVKEAIGLAPDSSRLLHHDPKVIIWGTGKARREFLHVDDMAAACVFVMGLDQPVYMEAADPSLAGFLNIGTGEARPSVRWRNLSAGLSAFPVKPSIIPASPTVLRRNCSMCHDSTAWAGGRQFPSNKDCKRSIRGMKSPLREGRDCRLASAPFASAHGSRFDFMIQRRGTAFQAPAIFSLVVFPRR